MMVKIKTFTAKAQRRKDNAKNFKTKDVFL